MAIECEFSFDLGNLRLQVLNYASRDLGVIVVGAEASAAGLGCNALRAGGKCSVALRKVSLEGFSMNEVSCTFILRLLHLAQDSTLLLHSAMDRSASSVSWHGLQAADQASSRVSETSYLLRPQSQVYSQCAMVLGAWSVLRAEGRERDACLRRPTPSSWSDRAPSQENVFP